MLIAFRLRAVGATWALAAVSFALAALLATWTAGLAVLVMVAFGEMGTSDPPPFTEQGVRYGSQLFAGLSVAAATLLAFVVTLMTIRIKRFRHPEVDQISASCVTAATVFATAAMLLLRWLAGGQHPRLLMLGGAIMIWCAALAATVPAATYIWPAVLGAVSIATIYVASAMANKIHW